MLETLFWIAGATLLEVHEDQTLLCKLVTEKIALAQKMGICYDLMVTWCHTLAANNFVCAVIRTGVPEYLCLHGNLCPLQ